MSLKTFSPELLPNITAVEVLDLRSVDLDDLDRDSLRAAGIKPTRVDGAGAQEIATLWRSLPPSEPMRCHFPPYGLRFWAGDDIVCEASICWKCNTIVEHTGGKPHRQTYDFDSQAFESIKLLDTLRVISQDA